MRRLLSHDGQIVIPAMLIFPTLMLFVFLIFETAKLSKEKIRHQFAMDAAAFVEMTNYSDFLNRTAYVNGAFPMRIFDEGYGDFMAECDGKNGCNGPITYASILFKNGVFPHVDGVYPDPKQKHLAETRMPNSKWEIKYGGPRAGWNDGSEPEPAEPFRLTTQEDAEKYWLSTELAGEIYKLYAQIYGLLGSVENAQYTVLKRLAGDHSFMKKSYWLNTSEPEGDMLAARFATIMPDFTSSNVVKPVCQKELDFCGNARGSGMQPYIPSCVTGGGKPPVKLDKSDGCSEGLFQLMWVAPDAIKTVQELGPGGDYPGIGLSMNWAVPEKNYWGVDFAKGNLFRTPSGRPELHTTISLRGDPNSEPSAVWPNPTPKFQVRQYP